MRFIIAILNILYAAQIAHTFLQNGISNSLSNGNAFLQKLHQTKKISTIKSKQTEDISVEEEPQEQRSDENIIQVNVKRYIPYLKPEEVKKAWISYTWEKGGGLPILELLSKSKQKRLLLPSFFEEELIASNQKSIEVQQYKITKWGVLHWDAMPNSHLGTVKCTNENDGTIFTWDVSYAVTNNYKFWNGITQSSITQASDNLVSYLTSQAMTYACHSSLKTSVSTKDVMDQWVQFIWNNGGGLPTFPPVLFKSKSNETISSRYMLPIFLKESLVSVDYTNNIISYKVDNPSIITCYPVYNHMGTVHFKPSNSTVDMIWNVTVTPYPNTLCKNYLKIFTSSVITTLSRNFQTNMKYYPNTTPAVPLRLPRGKNQDLVFGNVRKDTWIGNVLSAHLNDTRSTLDQSITLIQPWTWGEQRGESFEEYWT